ncbi:hypothetical protein ColKHC_14304 [Colletotrichum higginsianum]|nr:hypothetical protein ColKHC_14304 [Colletotrichum higginsianum]
MVYHAVARATISKKVKKLSSIALWEQHTRLIQRLNYADNPPHPHRNLITPNNLAHAKLLQPDYKIPDAIEGEDQEVA